MKNKAPRKIQVISVQLTLFGYMSEEFSLKRWTTIFTTMGPTLFVISERLLGLKLESKSKFLGRVVEDDSYSILL